MQLHPEQSKMVRVGYNNDSFYGNEGEWTKGGQLDKVFPEMEVSRGMQDCAFRTTPWWSKNCYSSYMNVYLRVIEATRVR
jgi:hypothetical protein